MKLRRLLAAVLAVCSVGLATLATPSADAAKSKAKKTYIYGLCGDDLCRVDAATRKTKRIAKHRGKKDYDGVSVSASGRTMLVSYGADVFRTARDAKRRRKLDGFGFYTFLSSDGRSAGWIQSYMYQSCTYFPYFSCISLTNYAAAVQRRTDKERNLVGSGVGSAGWYRNQLMIAKEPKTDEGNTKAEYICIVGETKKDDGDCKRTLARDPSRSFSAPAVSPDGRYLAVVSEPTPSKDADHKFKGRIEIFNAANGRRIRILTKGTKDDSPMFSPDSKRVAFQRRTSVLSLSVRGKRSKLISRNLRLSGPSWGKGK